MMFDKFDHKTLQEMFDGKEVSPVLPYESIDADRDTVTASTQASGRISISGVQPKYAMVEEGGQLRFAKEGEQGRFILKIAPVERHILDRASVPANEWLTMHIAELVYSIPTAKNCLCFFRNGEIAYLTRRFDVQPDDTKWLQEDFAAIANISKDTHGEDYKYDALSYADCAPLIDQHVNAAAVEKLKFFRIVCFNYLSCNDDAHLKNFSLMSRDGNDYFLTHAYDLLNTQLHLAEPRIFALKKGLYSGMKIDDTHSITGESFVEFGRRMGLSETLVSRELSAFCKEYPTVFQMVSDSPLSDLLKEFYFNCFDFRRKTLSF